MDLDNVSESERDGGPTLFQLFGQSGVQPLLLCLSGIRWLTALLAILPNAALIFVTYRNKNLHGTCNLFIAGQALFGNVALTSFLFPLFLAITGQNFIALGQCVPILAYAYFSNLMCKLALFLVSLDRLLIVSFPFLFGHKPLIFFGLSIALAGTYSAFVVSILWMGIEEPNKPVTCLIVDFADIGQSGDFSLVNAVGIIVLACANYVLLGALLKWKNAKSEQEKSNCQYTRQIYKMLLATTGLNIAGWMLNPAIRLVLPNLQLTALQNFYFSVSLSCITNLAMLLNPFLLYTFSKDYREAFKKAFPSIFSPHGKPTTVVALQRQKSSPQLLQITSQILTESRQTPF